MSLLQTAALPALFLPLWISAGLAPARTQSPPGAATPLQAADPTESMLAVQQDERWFTEPRDVERGGGGRGDEIYIYTNQVAM